jgi:heme/copper-type cytochrome/quinol oxidase subunit 2
MFNYYFIDILAKIISYRTYECALWYAPSTPGQISFQRPATQTMDQLVDLHHDIFSLLLLLCVIVFYLLAQLVYKFRATNFQTRRNFFFKAHTTLEIF